MIIRNSKKKVIDFNFGDITDEREYEKMEASPYYELFFLESHYDHSGNHHRTYTVLDRDPNSPEVPDQIFDETEEDYIEGVD